MGLFYPNVSDNPCLIPMGFLSLGRHMIYWKEQVIPHPRYVKEEKSDGGEYEITNTNDGNTTTYRLL